MIINIHIYANLITLLFIKTHAWINYIGGEIAKMVLLIINSLYIYLDDLATGDEKMVRPKRRIKVKIISEISHLFCFVRG